MLIPLAPTLTQRALPRLDARLRDLLLIVSGSLLVAALAQVRLPLPFTPVPLTGQTLAVLLVGAALGARRGAASLGLYTLLGLIGLPVFTGAGAGLVHLFGPTGGYLLGFVAAAYLVGRLAERGLERSVRTALLPFLAGSLVIYLCGIAWLSAFTGFQNAISMGLLPFLIGDALKLALAALLLPSLWKFVGQE